MLDGNLALALLPIAFFALGGIALSHSESPSRTYASLNAVCGGLCFLAGIVLLVRSLVTDALGTGALTFLVISWTAVLGTMVWAFARILSVQKRQDGTSYLDADVTIDDGEPPA